MSSSGNNGNFMPNNPPNSSGSTWGSGNSGSNRGNLDMPNLQALGINSGGNPGNQSGGAGNMNNPLGM
jgi:TAR DNA-binding protein 43